MSLSSTKLHFGCQDRELEEDRILLVAVTHLFHVEPATHLMTSSNKTLTMDVPKDDLNPELKVKACVKIIACKKGANSNGKLRYQVLETGILRPDKINRDTNQRVKK
jgi:hypothetical protein